MKIIVLVRTLNEEKNIVPYCTHYAWADKIMIADGGSTDQTIPLAAAFPKTEHVEVEIRPFEIQIPTVGGLGLGFMNPEPEHINFLISWGESEGADWLVFDDCDCWPNPTLERQARAAFEWARDKSIIMLYRLYMYGEDHYFPKMNIPGQSIWAWRPDRFRLRWNEAAVSRFDSISTPINPADCFYLNHPHVCLHYFRPDEKTDMYKSWGKPQVPILKSIYAPPERLPEWVLT